MQQIKDGRGKQAKRRKTTTNGGGELITDASLEMSNAYVVRSYYDAPQHASVVYQHASMIMFQTDG